MKRNIAAVRTMNVLEELNARLARIEEKLGIHLPEGEGEQVVPAESEQVAPAEGEQATSKKQRRRGGSE